MVVYSAEARSSVNNIDTLINQAVAQNNVYFQNSAVNIQFNLVHKGLVNHIEHDSMVTVLERLKHPSDGYLDDIFALRQSKQADLICLVTHRGAESAWALIMGTPHVGFRNHAFSIIRANQLTNHKLFAHEVAHTMGCNHDQGNTSGPLCYSYSKAHNFTGSDGVTYGTICSHRSPVAPYFGNPNVSYLGAPTGSSTANNARAINENAPLLVQFRLPPPPAPANDAFGNRAILSGFTPLASGNNEMGTKETGEPLHSSSGKDACSLWWSWTAPASGQAIIHTFGSDFDTCIAVYTGNSLGALQLVTRNDNSPGGPFNSQVASRVSFSAAAGVNYQIAVGGISRDVGNIFLAISLPGGPPAPPITLDFEAESGLLAAPLQRFTDDSASGNEFVSSASTAGSVSYNVQLPRGGEFMVWCRALATSFGDDSYFVSVNSGPEDIYDMAQDRWTNVWQWTRVNGRAGTSNPLTVDPRIFTLVPGSNSISFRIREADSKLDRIIITDDKDFVPNDSQGGEGDLPKLFIKHVVDAPSVELTVLGTPGQILQLESSVDLKSWIAGGVYTNSTGRVVVLESTEDARRWYRARVVP